MPKDRKKLDFHTLMAQPGFEWIRLYFEKNYPNKNFIVEPYFGGVATAESGVYYLSFDKDSHAWYTLKGKKSVSRKKWVLTDAIIWDGGYNHQVIKVKVI